MPSATNSTPTVRVLVAGGSYAGLSVAVNLLDLNRGVSPRMHPEPFVFEEDWPHVNFHITIVDERDGFLHIVGAPLALADSAYRDSAWVPFRDMMDLEDENVTFVHGSLSHVDCATKTATVLRHGSKDATTIEYDYFCAATGYRRVWPVRHIEEVARATHGVLVVGGGAVGIEMAAELKLTNPHVKVTLAHSRDQLLSSEGLSDECKDVSLELLKEAGVEVLLNHRLESHAPVESENDESQYRAKFTNGHTMDASAVIVGVSQSVPATDLMLPAEIPNAEFHYCAGDATKWSGIKRCGGAMRAGHLVAMNMHQHVLHSLTGHVPKYAELSEIPPMIVLAVGKKAVASGPHETNAGEDVMKKFFSTDLYLAGE
ncbi:hypothetical protein NLG97_g8399 [Lecanicillium saksenae]|uniref:Uncharacterized protein n=1 Tax=Lecanicillium saksenae TaxID=468837 RepID=A0ACC1QKF2_9HYPO|nr:hypothetical protein NLG97_g8399 [Lecanicillium saksenae]